MKPIIVILTTVFLYLIVVPCRNANAAPPTFQSTATSDLFMQQAGPAGIQTMFDANGQVVYQSGGSPGGSAPQQPRPPPSGFPLVINYQNPGSTEGQSRQQPSKKKPAPITPQIQIVNTPGSNCYMASFGPFFMQYCNPQPAKNPSNE